jgi:serine/threonine protein kinase
VATCCRTVVQLNSLRELERLLAPHGLLPLVPVRRRPFSLVFRARQGSTGRELFVKCLTSRSHGVRRNFDREIEILQVLNGKPGVANLVVSSMSEEVAFHACEHVLGRSLLAIAQAQEGRDLGVLLGHARSLARWIAALHRVGVAHRDLSPEHVLVRSDGTIVVVDFGMAKRTGNLSPEERLYYDGYDLQALGMILWEMICGHSIFPYRDQSLRQVLRREAELVREAELPAGVRRWLLDCLATRSEFTPNQRFFLR